MSKKLTKVEFTYDDGSQSYAEGEDAQKWTDAINEAIENDFIHGAEFQKLIQKVNFKEVKP